MLGKSHSILIHFNQAKFVLAENWIKIDSDFLERLDDDVAPIKSKPINWYDDDFNDYYVSYF